MRAGHEEIPVAQESRAAFRTAAMDGAILANDIAPPDLDCTLRSRIETQILRDRPEYRTMANEIFRADADVAFNHDVRLNNAFLSQNDAGSDD
jgi:hypothetical protein